MIGNWPQDLDPGAVGVSVQLRPDEDRDVNDGAILGKIRQLDPQELAEVMDFIDFLITRRPQRHPLVQLMGESSGPDVELGELRRRLSKISGTMAETVCEGRDERG